MPRYLQVPLGLLAILILAPPIVARQHSSPPQREPDFTRLFAEAFRNGDRARMAALVHERPTEFATAFEFYAGAWFNLEGDATQEQRQVLANARALAETVAAELSASGLLKMTEVLEDLDQEKRHGALEARADFTQGEQAFQAGNFRQAIEPLGRAREGFDEIGWIHGVAWCEAYLGGCYFSLDEYEPATVHHESGLALFEQIGNPREIAFSAHYVAVCLYSLGAYARAIDLEQRAVILFRQHAGARDVVSALNYIGLCHFSLGHVQQAIASHEQALALGTKTGDPGDTSRSLNNLGICYEALGQYAKAIELHEQALTLREREGNAQWVVDSLNNLGLCYSALGQYHKAIELHQRVLATTGPMRGENAPDTQNNLGLCYLGLGQYQPAREHFEKALATFLVLKNPQPIARTNNNLGTCSFFLGEYEKALSWYARALSFFEAIGNPRDTATTLANVGSCYERLGQYEKAVAYLERAAALQEGGNPGELALTLNNLGVGHVALGHYGKAIDCHTRALALNEQIGNPQDIATSLTNLGFSLSGFGQSDRALEYHRQALALKEDIGNPLSIAWSLHGLGDAYFDLGLIEKAIEHHRRTLALREEIGNPEGLAYSLYNLALCDLAVGKHESALSFLEACAAALAKVRRRALAEASRTAFSGKWEGVAVKTSEAVAALDKNAIARAFPLVESFRVRALLEGLQERLEGVVAAVDPKLGLRRVRILNEMISLRLELERTADAGEPETLSRMRAEISGKEQELEKTDEELRRKNSALAQLALPETATLANVRTVLAADEALLLYVLGEKASYLWVVTGDEAKIFPLATSTRLGDAGQRLISLLAETSRRDREFIAPARELFELLLKPAWDLIAPKRSLIIIPDGLLGFLPFEVLLTRDPAAGEREKLSSLPYLLREKTVRYAPSGSFLVFLAEHAGNKSTWAKDLLLLGDPLYASEPREMDSLAVRASESLLPENFSRLRKTRDEVVDVASRLVQRSEAEVLIALRDLPRSGTVQASRFDLWVGNEASKANLLRDLSPYRIVHLATHGYFDTQFPWFSGLVLSAEGGDATRGFLSLPEIAELELHAEVVFLSACETAQGKLTHAEGILNTARYFLLAGARSVVATQWQVADDAAPIVASVFYQRLFAGASPAEALRQGKLALIEERADVRGSRPVDTAGEPSDAARFAHPAAWAPFVMFGK